MDRQARPAFARRLIKPALFVCLSILFHLVLVLVLVIVLPRGLDRAALSNQTPIKVSVLDGPLVLDPWSVVSNPEIDDQDPKETPEQLEEEKPEETLVKLPNGQIVDVPPPLEEKEPEHADYLAEHNNVAIEETRSERYKINPTVLASRYSEQSMMAFEDVEDLGFTEPSTGARAGNPSPDVSRSGRFSSIVSPFTATNKEGLGKPVPSSRTYQELAGAPNNDLLNERVGAGVNLNTREFLFANYFNRIRRQVNYYWQQNLDNLPSGTRLTRNQYETTVDVTLNADGTLQSIVLSEKSSIDALDNAVVQAFHMSSPFPNPPAQLVDPDGRARLPDFSFIVQVGQARAQFIGVDPRADVQFPGILKSPH